MVLGAGAVQVRQFVADDAGGDGIRWVLQTRRRGTGDELAQALPDIDARSRVVVLPGVMPLIRAGTIKALLQLDADLAVLGLDRKSTRLNSSYVAISYAVICLKNKTYIFKFN